MKIEKRFTENGTYSVTGFILNMTKGITSEFDVSLNGNSMLKEGIKDVKHTVQEIINKEGIIQEVQASSTMEPVQTTTDNSDIAEVSLAIVGLGILFGAVYGVKRQVDNNSRRILLDIDTIKEKIIQAIRGSNPKEIIQTRLAKGEITLEEYELLKAKLN